MQLIEANVIYENPLPQLKSRHSMFPFLCQMKDKSLLAIHVIGEAFESVDSTSCVSRSYDGGKTWSEPVPMFDKSRFEHSISDYCKPVLLKDGRIVALGYAYHRKDENLPLGNAETGGLLEDFVFYSISEDNGKTWGKMKEINCAWGPHVEASAPITVLKDGSWITPVTGFPNWEGQMTGTLCGRMLRSEDEGKTWDDHAVCMEFVNRQVTCYEQRTCQLESGTIICIGWNEDITTGERLENHYTVSYDSGKTWSRPVSTGILGQVSSVCAIGGERLLALHAKRCDTNCPGIYAYIVDFFEKNWHIVEEALVWSPATAMVKNTKMAEIFSYLKFGQPGAIYLDDGDVLMSHWCEENGQYKTMATRIRL